jgi:hypothetical protein
MPARPETSPSAGASIVAVAMAAPDRRPQAQQIALTEALAACGCRLEDVDLFV